MAIATDPHVRPGPTPGDLVRLDTKITRPLEAALNELVTVTGQSKASLVRRAIATLLADADALPPEYADLIDPTPTSGPGLSIHRKDTR
jgi:hypothetical protein